MIEVIILGSNSQKLLVGGKQYYDVINFLKKHLEFVRNNIHANFKFLHFPPHPTKLVFVSLSNESIQKIKEHMHKLTRDDETMSVVFDGSTLKIITNE